MRVRAALLCLALVCGAAGAEPDAQRLGAALAYPVGDASNWMRNPWRVGSWSALDRVAGLAVRRVPAAAQVQPLPRSEEPARIRYRLRGVEYTLQDYLERQRATGLIILKDGRIVAEHYRYGRSKDARFLSFSMAKSVTSLLVGIALECRVIASLDDSAEQYVPALQGTAYGGTSLRHLLRMSSGLAFTERYDGHDDVARMASAFGRAPDGTLAVLRSANDRVSPAGTVFHYAGAETEVLGRVLAGASGRTLAQLTSEWLWTPIGAEHEAFWRIGADGQEGAAGYFNASLRDWARLGLLLAHDGQVGERAVVPREYLLDATDAGRQPAAFRPGRATPLLGYGYQFWLLPLAQRTFAMQGIYGQALYVQPASGIVMVVTSAWEHASSLQDPEPARERYALWLGVLRSLGGRTD
jgi:CubicO group peptidase (beta-lactamase class C family)